MVATVFFFFFSLISLIVLMLELMDYSRILPAIKGFKDKTVASSYGRIVEYVSRRFRGMPTLIPVIEFLNEFTGEVIKREFYNSDIDSKEIAVGTKVRIEYIDTGEARINDPIFTKEDKFDIKAHTNSILFFAGFFTFSIICFLFFLSKGF